MLGSKTPAQIKLGNNTDKIITCEEKLSKNRKITEQFEDAEDRQVLSLSNLQEDSAPKSPLKSPKA